MDQTENEVQIELQILPQNHHLFKIFGHIQFSFEKAYAKSPLDWSGFYTQLTPDHSLRYLTKKWDDGADYACLVLLKPLHQFKLLKVCSKQIFADPKISGQTKAKIFKDTLKKKSDSDEAFKEYKMCENDRLVHFLGQKDTLIECVDNEDKEIVIPHELLNAENFTFETLISFKKSSDGLLRTIGWCEGISCQTKPIWLPVKGESQYEPHLLFKQQPQIRQIIEKISLD